MRALLIVNPHATSTTPLRRDVIAGALASAVELEVVQTRYRGHAGKLAAAAAADPFGLVMTLGGDGTVNEAVNGLLSARRPGCAPGGESAVPTRGHPTSRPGSQKLAVAIPAFAALPGGNANVFTRALGLPPDPVDATGEILAALAAGRLRTISLGLAGDRYFTFNAGLGFDAEVVRAVDGRRARGRAVTPTLFFATALRQFFLLSDRRHAALRLEVDGEPIADPLFLALVANTAPWTYLGSRPVRLGGAVRFESGLDVFALRGLGTLSTVRTVRRMLSQRSGPPGGRSVVIRKEVSTITARSERPIALQVDGEYMGEREMVTVRSIPRALRVLA